MSPPDKKNLKNFQQFSEIRLNLLGSWNQGMLRYCINIRTLVFVLFTFWLWKCRKTAFLRNVLWSPSPFIRSIIIWLWPVFQHFYIQLNHISAIDGKPIIFRVSLTQICTVSLKIYIKFLNFLWKFYFNIL